MFIIRVGLLESLVLLLSHFQTVEATNLKNECRYEILSKAGLLTNHTLLNASKLKDFPCHILLTTTIKEDVIRSNNSTQFRTHYVWNICEKTKLTELPQGTHGLKLNINERRQYTEGLKRVSQLSRVCLYSLPFSGEEEKKAAKIRKKRQLLIYANTHFCGKGNISRSYTDLGSDPADICCREHDSCNLFVNAQQRKYRYTNENRLIYQVHCQCDQRFYWCLQRTIQIFGEENTAASKIRDLFFVQLGMTCFFFDTDDICSKTERRCERRGLFPICSDVCVLSTYSYGGIVGKVKDGAIHRLTSK